MLSQIKQAWKLKDVRRKILYTLMMIVVFRIGATIPVPGVNTNIIKGMVDSNGLLSLYNMFTGGAFSQFTLFALGIGPAITASIIIQLLTIGFESLEELQKSGEEGKKKINKYTKYIALVLAFIQAIAITLGIVKGALISKSAFFIITVTVGTVERRSIDNNEFSIQASGVTGIDRCCTSVLFFSLIRRADVISFAKENILT